MGENLATLSKQNVFHILSSIWKHQMGHLSHLRGRQGDQMSL
jgi:hypothetical protein